MIETRLGGFALRLSVFFGGFRIFQIPDGSFRSSLSYVTAKS
jgi:hypothetical protein